MRKAVQKLKGMYIKMVPLHLAGIPDRLVLLPGGVIFFCEVKGTGEDLRPIQRVIIKKIRKLGVKVFILEHTSQIEELCNTKM